MVDNNSVVAARIPTQLKHSLVTSRYGAIIMPALIYEKPGEMKLNIADRGSPIPWLEQAIPEHL